jgi:hypothetical protein
MLLGDVGQVEEVREGAGDGQRVVHRHARQLVGEHAEVRVVAGAAALRQRPHAFDRREDVLARLRADGVAEQFTQQRTSSRSGLCGSCIANRTSPWSYP